MDFGAPTSRFRRFPTAFVVTAPNVGARRLASSISPRRRTSSASFARRRTTCLFSDGNSSDSFSTPGDQALSKLRSLRDALDSAVEREDYASAARLRDAISQLEKEAASSESGDKFDVISAHELFYAAYGSADADAMAEVWLNSDTASCTHPLNGMVSGYDAVIQSWRSLFQTSGKPASITSEILSMEISRNLAWVVCRQQIQNVRGRQIIGGERIATNLFQKSGGRWLVVHHHASPVVVEEAGDRS